MLATECRRRRSHDADVEFCRPDHRGCGTGLHRRYAQNEAESGYAAKTDRLDARRLADALRRESVVSIYFPPPPIRELRELCRHRLMLTQLRTRVLQRMRALLLRQGLGDPPARRLRSVEGQRWLDGVVLPPQAQAALTTMRCVERGISEPLTRVEAEVRREAATDPIRPTSPDDPRGRADCRADAAGRDRRHRPVSHAWPSGQLCGAGALRGHECEPYAVRPQHHRRVAMVALGSQRSRPSRAPSSGSREAMGAQTHRAQRRHDRAGGAHAPGVSRHDAGVAAGVILTRPVSAHRLIIRAG